MRKFQYFLTVSLAATLTLTSCGGGGSQSNQNNAEKDQTQQRPDMAKQEKDSKSKADGASEMADSAMADLTNAGDQASVTVKTPGTNMQNMRYDLNMIKIQKGQTVQLTLKNVAPESAKAMKHNFVVVKPQNARDVATAGMKNKANDYLPKDQSNILAHTKILNPGEKTTVTFTMGETGTYEYICTYPGHYPTMKGKIKVVEG